MQIAGTDSRIIVAAGIAIGVVAIVTAYQAKKGASAVLSSINPLNNNNIFYRGVNSAGEVVTGDKDFSLGVWAWELLNPSKVAAENAVLRQNVNPSKEGGLEEPWIDPRNPYNYGVGVGS